MKHCGKLLRIRMSSVTADGLLGRAFKTLNYILNYHLVIFLHYNITGPGLWSLFLSKKTI